MKPNTIIITSGTNLAIVATVCIIPEVLEPKVFKTLINNTVKTVIGIIRFSFKPSNKTVWLPNITAIAAIVAGKNKTDCIHPVNIPNFFPYISSM